MIKRSYQVGFTADEHDMIQQALMLYRKRNPKSRAVHGWTEYGSTGAVRKYTCVFCRTEIATEAKAWPPTRRATEATRDHVAACACAYLDDEAACEIGHRLKTIGVAWECCSDFDGECYVCGRGVE